MNRYAADLHIHTALSPCGDKQMTPPEIARVACERGLALIAVCDHNSARNAEAVRQAGATAGLAVLAGMEIATAEEVHLLGIFPDEPAAMAASRTVRDMLPDGDAEYFAKFGRQVLMNADGGEAGEETRALARAVPMSLEDAVALVRQHGGLAIPAHVDRPTYGLLSRLGQLPAEGLFDALDVSGRSSQLPQVAVFASSRLTAITSSDAHYLRDIGGSWTELVMEAPTFAELAMALRGEGGRRAFRVTSHA